MEKVLENIKRSVKENKKLLAVLIDPEKMDLNLLPLFIDKINKSVVTHVFIGGSTVKTNITQKLVLAIKPLTKLPLVLFPGDVSQISNHADAILFLSLLSGRNPDYLIGKQVEAVSVLKDMNLEVIPTAYILIEGGKETAVQKVTRTKPLSDINAISNTARAGELLGMQLIYLEAGSGAMKHVDEKIIIDVKKILNSPLIVGGGIRNKKTLERIYKAGADMVVIGNIFEENNSFFDELKDIF